MVVGRSSLSFDRSYLSLQGPRIEASAALEWNRDIVPSDSIDNRIARDGQSAHITILSKDELTKVLASVGGSEEELRAKIDAFADKWSKSSQLVSASKGHPFDSWIDVGLGAVADEKRGASASSISSTASSAVHAPSSGSSSSNNSAAESQSQLDNNGKYVEYTDENMECVRMTSTGMASSHLRNRAFFKVIWWPFGQDLRIHLGLQPKPFHITIAFDKQDIHGSRFDKNAQRLVILLPPSKLPALIGSHVSNNNAVKAVTNTLCVADYGRLESALQSVRQAINKGGIVGYGLPDLIAIVNAIIIYLKHWVPNALDVSAGTSGGSVTNSGLATMSLPQTTNGPLTPRKVSSSASSDGNSNASFVSSPSKNLNNAFSFDSEPDTSASGSALGQLLMEALDASVVVNIKAFNDVDAVSAARDMVLLCPVSPRGHLRLADIITRSLLPATNNANSYTNGRNASGNLDNGHGRHTREMAVLTALATASYWRALILASARSHLPRATDVAFIDDTKRQQLVSYLVSRLAKVSQRASIRIDEYNDVDMGVSVCQSLQKCDQSTIWPIKVAFRLDEAGSGGTAKVELDTCLWTPCRLWTFLNASQRRRFYNLLRQVDAEVISTSADAAAGWSEIDIYATYPLLRNDSVVRRWVSPPLDNGVSVSPSVHEQHKLARNFSWVVPNVLAGLSIPRHAEDIQALKSLGVSLVCTVVGESPLPRAWFNTANNSGDSSSNNSIRNVFWNVQNYMPPTVKQVDEFMAAVETELSQPASDGEPPRACLVHCGGGKGRAGTFLACYLAKYGPYPIDFAARAKSEKPQQQQQQQEEAEAQGPFMSSSEAVALIRQMRPGSIETHEQEAFVREYVNILWARASGADPSVSSPSTESANGGAAHAPSVTPDLSGIVVDSAFGTAQAMDALTIGSIKPTQGKHVPSPDMIVLCGLPGCGKSTFGRYLAGIANGYEQFYAESTPSGTDQTPSPPPPTLSKTRYVHLNQDECGSSIQNAVGSYSRRLTDSPIILDRVNPTAEERKHYLQLAFQPRKAVAVYFDVGAAACIASVLRRTEHPTLTNGVPEHVERVIRSFARQMQRPSTDEGFAAVYTIRTFAEAKVLADQWRSAALSGRR